MGKITVKHFLNVNLKPYLVRGEKFFPVYLLITVSRKTTKVKSHSFSELQTDTDFNQIVGSKEASNELITVENLIQAQVSNFSDDFDPNLFSAFYNLTPLFPIINSATFEQAIGKVKKIPDHSQLVLGLRGANKESGLTFYDWFKPDFQKLNTKFLKDHELKDSSIDILNELVLVCFFERLDIIARTQRKYADLVERYPVTFNDFYDQALSISKSIK